LSPPNLDVLIRLLDDETPEVRRSVVEALRSYRGDVSERMGEIGRDLSRSERALLSELLGAGRRDRLRAEWDVPSGGWKALGNDWDRAEALLNLISDFLHDGVTLRLPMSDGLDLLAEEYEIAGGVECPAALGRWLFADGRFSGNEEHFHAPQNSDLAWVLATGLSNPIGLALVYILVGRRLGIEVQGCAFPSRFLCRIQIDGRVRILDCYDEARSYDLEGLLARGNIRGQARRALTIPAPPGAILVRLVRNLHHALVMSARGEDAELTGELLASLNADP